MEVTLDAAVTQRDNISLLDGYYRERLHGHKGGCDLVCRPISASGKSNITDLFEKGLHKKGFSTYLLGAENLRYGHSAYLAIAPEDRSENISQRDEMITLLTGAGINALTIFISPYLEDHQ